MSKALVGIVMGSQSDWDMMQHAARQLKDFGIAYEARALSAHRTPDLLMEWIDRWSSAARNASSRAPAARRILQVSLPQRPRVRAGRADAVKTFAGPGFSASIVQMPKGIPVATFAIGEAGAANAALFSVAMLAMNDAALADKLTAFRRKQGDAVKAVKLPEL